jgi:hypothetical protein
VDAETAALLEVTRRHTRALARQLRTVARLHAQLADRLDETAAQTAQPRRHSDEYDHETEDA